MNDGGKPLQISDELAEWHNYAVEVGLQHMSDEDKKTYFDTWKAEDPEGYEHTVKVLGKSLHHIWETDESSFDLDSYKKALKEVDDAPKDKSAIIALTAVTHGNGFNTREDIVKVLGIPLNVVMLSEILFERVTSHPEWDCRRAPHALFVDCLYLVCKHKKIKLTSRFVAEKTKEFFGVGTQPRPNDWCKQYSFIVETVLS